MGQLRLHDHQAFGYIGASVDDLFMAGPKKLNDTVIHAIQQVWKTSTQAEMNYCHVSARICSRSLDEVRAYITDSYKDYSRKSGIIRSKDSATSSCARCPRAGGKPASPQGLLAEGLLECAGAETDNDAQRLRVYTHQTTKPLLDV